MSSRADPALLLELKRYGDVNIESCFNCGNCTAICPLSTESDSFPRRMIRYAQLGLQEKLLSSKELWLCYYCSECTETCPRQADPGEFMATARRFVIAHYDRIGLARLLYISPLFNLVFLIVLAAVLGLIIYSFRGPMPGDTLNLFAFIPAKVIHDLGLIAGVIIIATAFMGFATMILEVRKNIPFPKGTRLTWSRALWDAFGVEVLSQRSYRQECETSEEIKPWYIQKWFIHASIMWGFLGLFGATALDYLLDISGVKPTGTWVPLYHPVRLLGTIAGLFLVYGTTLAMINRYRKVDEAYAHSTPSDWAFLILMWLSGMTGFALEISIYLPQPYAWSYWMLIVHLVVAGELILLTPFSKFAHAIYRTIALYIHALKPIPQPEKAPTVASAD